MPELESWVTWPALLPAIHPGLSVLECGARDATHHSACPILRHSESRPLGLSEGECGATGSASGRTACPFWPTLRESRTRHDTTRESSPPWFLSPPLLPVWMYVSFLSPWCRTSLPFDFLSVLVVRGGEVCLPTPPSWFSVAMSLKYSFLPT